jgi:Tol biopolymer transport system component/DNA-binding winged helix-turn-helix (wHTH) protein
MSKDFCDFYEFGPYRVHRAKRLVTHGAEVVSVAPKSFELLLLLLESQGRALTKDELIQSLWPDTFVEEANLKFQISQLRKALGQPAADWIETVPKHGYRFTAPVTLPIPLAAPPVVHKAQHFKWWIAAGLIVSALVLFIVIGRSKPAGTLQMPVPLTTYPGIELHPALSPDGSQVAFAWNGAKEDNFDIYVMVAGPGEPIRLTADPDPEFAPAWSPDGRWIAFLRGPRDGTVGVYVIPALGGAVARKITEVRLPLADNLHRTGTPTANLTWTPNGEWLALPASGDDDGSGIALWLVEVKTGQRRRLTEPPHHWVGDFGPAFSEDGRMLAFVRVRSLSVGYLHVLPLSHNYMLAGQPRQMPKARGAIETPAWTPNSGDIVFSSGVSFGIRHLARVSATDTSAMPAVLPIGEDAKSLSVSRNGRLVYAHYRVDSNIWMLDLHQPGSPPRKLIASTRSDHTPHFSPDGHKIVFASSRSGADEIWVGDADGTHALQLTDNGGPLTANPQWSPDGNVIVFSSRRAEWSDLYLLDMASAQVRQLTFGGAHADVPRWSRDGKWIYFVSNRSGRHEVWKLSRDGGSAVQVTHNGGVTAQESKDGSFLYFAKARPAVDLWRIPVGGGVETKIADESSDATNFVVATKGIYFVVARKPRNTASIMFYDFSSRDTTELLDTGKHWSFGLSISPDERYLLYSVIDFLGSDLMMADGIR